MNQLVPEILDFVIVDIFGTFLKFIQWYGQSPNNAWITIITIAVLIIVIKLIRS